MSLLRSEWIKLRATRSTWWLLGGALVAEGTYAGLTSSLISAKELRDEPEPILAGSAIGMLLVLVLGVLVATGEYRHGLVNSTFLVTPKRERVVLAKLGAGALVGLAAALLLIGINALLAVPVLSSKDALPPGDDILSIYLGVGVGIVLSCVFGVALGTLLSNQVVAVVVALALFFVLRNVALLLGSAGGFFPAEALTALQGSSDEEDLLSQVAGGFVFFGYCLVLSVAGIFVTQRRQIG